MKVAAKNPALSVNFLLKEFCKCLQMRGLIIGIISLRQQLIVYQRRFQNTYKKIRLGGYTDRSAKSLAKSNL